MSEGEDGSGYGSAYEGDDELDYGRAYGVSEEENESDYGSVHGVSEGDDDSDYGSAYGVSEGDNGSDYWSAHGVSQGDDGSDHGVSEGDDGSDHGVNEGDDANGINYHICLSSDETSWSDCATREEDGWIGYDWMDDSVVANAGTRERQPQPCGTVMKFYLLRGPSSRFTTAAAADDDAAARGPIMDAAVWGQMPEELIWEVLRFVPVTKHFELQLVSRKWRQVLRSAHFRKTVAQSEQQHESVVAYLWPWACRSVGDSRTSNIKVNLKAWEVDLSTVLPSSFCWKDDDSNSDYDYKDRNRNPRAPWIVVAAAHGLVCISTDTQSRHELRQPGEKWEPCKPWANRYCVVNPVTRTCVELPPLPFEARTWLPPTGTAVAFLGRSNTSRGVWTMATYDLAPAAAGGTGVWVTRKLHTNIWARVRSSWVMLGGETYHCNNYCFDHKVHVTAPGPGPSGGREHVVLGKLDEPSPTLLNVDTEYMHPLINCRLMVHRGAVYFVANIGQTVRRPSDQCGVWRLARAGDGRMEWEGVTVLDAPELERLTGITGVHTLNIQNAYAVREFLCCEVSAEAQEEEWPRAIYERRASMGFNLDTGKWEVLYAEKGLMYAGKAMELSTDLFLS